jgi:sortase A
VYGYITIDKININMAIYLGASEYNMSLGAAHLSQTSIPIGGKNTNSVIAGHCGYGGRQMFRYIENLSVGDEVKITTPFNKLTYKVVDKKTIKPNALENIKIQKGKDMITLFTCTPYPTSKYRCCVFCERVK